MELRDFGFRWQLATFFWASTFITVDYLQEIPHCWYLQEISQTSSKDLLFSEGIQRTLSGSVDMIVIDRVLAPLATPHVSAFGEVGLDYFKGPSASVQQQLLDHLLSRAAPARKPIVLHCRDHIGSFSHLWGTHYIFLHDIFHILQSCIVIVLSGVGECEWYPSLTAHQHQKGHTVPKQV